ncbi:MULTISPECIES: ferritin-like domain-containing protein [unclassified Mesorhizobium]|uniref:ferritin-like domain-containing protein n=1 Tax=unclassified Mesorhizobium TaxID=325217 RepID=UPI000FDA3FA5|nr:MULTISPECIES: ferritin-like domain-containing protein [unclassified Mesorhizobium]TGQ04131.1 ferritin-like domain-containing protein [Mesorhizobium sp. M2E.F.Ca.ET.219.01.1.1]TGT63324.1 ferritin-like domain-containing protein [Mesorhizobium sp. M2E.F.Ca.ET.166.01.1.1]TGV96949.1 ferritin-like domain-containing protein [Mesorhizobium sp. M2E.F.Ca.ET.154.01.1.1]
MFSAAFQLFLSRRHALQLGIGAALASTLAPVTAAHADDDIKEEDIFRFAFNLEYMEAEYYLRGITGKGIEKPDVGSKPGDVVGGKKVTFETPALGLGGMLFEDVGVTAYAGAATVLKNKEFLAAAAGILAVEAYHMGMARASLYRMGEKAWKAANAICGARDKIDGPGDKAQGIYVDGKANFIPSTPDAIGFTRTPQEVLRIVYRTDQSGVSKGGFYPNGMNGALKST